jgi:hypothetical protein
MARRKRKRTRPLKSVKIDVIAHDRLEKLQDELASQRLPSYVEDMEILSALVLFTTPEQLAGSLLGYWNLTDRLRADEGPSDATD